MGVIHVLVKLTPGVGDGFNLVEASTSYDDAQSYLDDYLKAGIGRADEWRIRTVTVDTHNGDKN